MTLPVDHDEFQKIFMASRQFDMNIENVTNMYYRLLLDLDPL